MSTPIAAVDVLNIQLLEAEKQEIGGRKQFCLLGDRVYPYAGTGRNKEPSAIRRRVDGGSWTALTASGYTDLLSEAKLYSVVVTTFDEFLYDLEITDADGVEIVSTLVTCSLKVGRPKHGNIDQNMSPFADIVIATDPTQIDAISYSVSGDQTTAKTAITRDVIWSGTHTTTNNSATLKNSALDWTELAIRIDTDIAKNITDGSEAVITGVTSTDISAALSGGTDDDWDIGETYNIVDGESLALVAQGFQISFGSAGLYICKLHVEDGSANERTASVVVLIG